jgi:anaerobic ribonucleoside-triphosphate reductase activating protein
MILRLGHTPDALRPTLHNGPGWRVAFWVQGCAHRCTDRCLSPHLLDPAGGHPVPTDDLAAAVRRVVRAAAVRVKGVTVLGGEPFEQGAAVAAVLSPLRADGLSAIVYSGHTHEWLRRAKDPEIDALLGQTDLLIDGPFLPHLYNDRLAWRGSTNQRLLCLTNRYTPAELEAAYSLQGKGFSFQLREDGVSVSGLQTPTGADAVIRAFGLPVLREGSSPDTSLDASSDDDGSI